VIPPPGCHPETPRRPSNLSLHLVHTHKELSEWFKVGFPLRFAIASGHKVPRVHIKCPVNLLQGFYLNFSLVNCVYQKAYQLKWRKNTIKKLLHSHSTIAQKKNAAQWCKKVGDKI